MSHYTLKLFSICLTKQPCMLLMLKSKHKSGASQTIFSEIKLLLRDSFLIVIWLVSKQVKASTGGTRFMINNSKSSPFGCFS